MSYTAKTVILEMFDNYGGSAITGVRSVDFYLSGSKITILAADITCYATNNYAAFPPDAVFDTSLSKLGAGDYTSCLNATETSRIICVFDSEITFDEIRINNYHSTGGTSYYGVQNVEIIISSDTITDTVYGNSVSNSTVIFDGVFDQHVNTDNEDEQILTLGIPISTFSFTGTGGSLTGGQGVISSESVPPPFIDKPNYTAKSVVLDIANTWGSTYSGIRSIDFWLDGEKVANSSALSTAYATGYISNYLPGFVFDTSLSKVGDAEYNALQYAGVLRRVICVFNSLTAFDEIRINNYVDWGSNTDRGVKDVVITVSTDTITDTTPNAPISNAIIAFDGTFEQHIATVGEIDGNVEDEQNLVLNTLEPIFNGIGGAVAGGQGVVTSRNTATFVSGSGGAIVGGTTTPRATLRASFNGLGGAVIAGAASIETSLVITGSYTQPLAEISGKAINGYILYGNYNPRVPRISGTALNTVILTGQLHQPMASIFGTNVEIATATESIGTITPPAPTITSQAVTDILGNGTITAPKPKINGSAVTQSLMHGDISVKPPVISSQMSSEGFIVGNLTSSAPTISATMFNTNNLVGNFAVKHAEISGVAINSIVAYGNYTAPQSRVKSICDNHKDTTIIKYRRDKCAYA